MFSKLIGRNKEIDNIKDVYKTDTPIWILGPPVIGKSTIINSFLNNTIGNRQEQWFCIDLYNMNWLSDTDIYNYFRDMPPSNSYKEGACLPEYAHMIKPTIFIFPNQKYKQS